MGPGILECWNKQTFRWACESQWWGLQWVTLLLGPWKPMVDHKDCQRVSGAHASWTWLSLSLWISCLLNTALNEALDPLLTGHGCQRVSGVSCLLDKSVSGLLGLILAGHGVVSLRTSSFLDASISKSLGLMLAGNSGQCLSGPYACCCGCQRVSRLHVCWTQLSPGL